MVMRQNGKEWVKPSANVSSGCEFIKLKVSIPSLRERGLDLPEELKEESAANSKGLGEKKVYEQNWELVYFQ